MVDEAGPTDVAALAGGAIATSLALSASSGPYEWLGMITSASLLLIIFAYVWPHRRNKLQSFAAAGAIAISAIPGVGFVLERVLGWGGAASPLTDGSRVDGGLLAASWLAITLICAFCDLSRQPRLKKSSRKRTRPRRGRNLLDCSGRLRRRLAACRGGALH